MEGLLKMDNLKLLNLVDVMNYTKGGNEGAEYKGYRLRLSHSETALIHPGGEIRVFIKKSNKFYLKGVEINTGIHNPLCIRFDNKEDFWEFLKGYAPDNIYNGLKNAYEFAVEDEEGFLKNPPKGYFIAEDESNALFKIKDEGSDK